MGVPPLAVESRHRKDGREPRAEGLEVLRITREWPRRTSDRPLQPAGRRTWESGLTGNDIEPLYKHVSAP